MRGTPVASAFRFSRQELCQRLLEIETTLDDAPDAKGTRTAKLREEGAASEGVLDLVYGAAAVAEVKLHDDKVISLRDAHNLLLWVLADGSYLPWAFVKKKPLIKKCVMLYIPGMDVDLWLDHKDGALSSMAALFGRPMTTIANHPTTTAAQSAAVYLRVPVKAKEKKGQGRSSDQKPKKKQTRPGTPCTYEELLATSQERMAYGIPHESEAAFRDRGFVYTVSGGEGRQPLVAVDCEMCETAQGSELTRMSLLAESGEVLVDTLVKPERPITDYRTPYSGITPKMMHPVTTDLAEAQELFCKYVGGESILVGHSLENDLTALQIFHSRLIDTSIIYPHPAGFPRRSSLKYLAKHHLGKVIQDGSHDSVMDAGIALELVKLKRAEGLDFGLPKHRPTKLVRLTEVLSEQKRVCCMIDRPETIQKHSFPTTHSIPCQTDRAVTEKLLSQMSKDHDFIWAQYQNLYRHYIAEGEGGEIQGATQLEGVLEEVNATVQQIYDAAPVNALLMICTGHGDTTKAIKRQAEKVRREAGLEERPPWTEEDESEWAALSNRVVQGLLFAKVKGTD